MVNNIVIPYVELSILFVSIILSVIIYKWHTNPENTFNLAHALMDDTGKTSLFRIGQAVCLISSTWGFVVLIQQGKLTEMYFTTYMGIWAGVGLANKIFGKAPDANAPKS